MTVLTVITSAILLYAALGYRIGEGGEVVRNGLLLVDSKPVAADVYINGENKNDPTASRFVLPAGLYSVTLKQDGYRKWARSVKLAASGVENLYYPLLVPSKLNPSEQLNLTRPDIISQSPDRKLVFSYSKQAGVPQIIQLDKDQSKLGALTLPASFLKDGSGFGVLKVVEWAPDSRHILVQQNLANSSRLLSIDTKNPLSSIDITATIGRKVTSPHYAGRSTDQVYGISGSNVVKFNIANGQSELAMKAVKSYFPFDEDTISFVRYNGSKKQIESGVKNGETITVIHSKKTKDSSESGQGRYFEFDGVYYLATQLSGESSATVYRNPLKSPILPKQLSFTKIKLADSDLFKLSDNNQFILLRKGKKVAVYDFEHARQSRFSISESGAQLEWMNSHHLLQKNANGTVSLSDYDGTNNYKMLKVDYGSLMFSNNLENSFYIKKTSAGAELSIVPMTI